NFVNPDAFVFIVSVLYLTMNVVGGMGTLAGPVVGAGSSTVLPETLRAFAEYKEFLSGALLLAFLIFFPRGIVGLLRPIAVPAHRGPVKAAALDVPVSANQCRPARRSSPCRACRSASAVCAPWMRSRCRSSAARSSASSAPTARARRR